MRACLAVFEATVVWPNLSRPVSGFSTTHTLAPLQLHKVIMTLDFAFPLLLPAGSRSLRSHNCGKYCCWHWKTLVCPPVAGVCTGANVLLPARESLEPFLCRKLW